MAKFGTLQVEPPVAALTIRRVKLEVQKGPDAGLTRMFDDERVSIGTAPGNSLVLTDGAVSGHHVELGVGPQGRMLRDLDSSNGTYVGGLRVREVFAQPGMEIDLGRSRLRFDVLPEETELELASGERCSDLIGTSPASRRVFAVLAKVAPRDVTVLVTGESGTGKELAARALHDQSSRQGPLVVVDCGAMPAGLMESEILGHAKGAFTGADRARAGAFERAHGGTLLLDEIGELPLELQPKLLRALETRTITPLGGETPLKVDVRVVAATHRDLRGEVNRGTFRGDLYYRLSVIEVRLPPLRERPEDVLLLARHFLEELAAREGQGQRYQLSADTERWMQAHRWPGNVRELRNFVERAVSLADGRLLTVAPPEEMDAPGQLGRQMEPQMPAPPAGPGGAALAPFAEAKRAAVEVFEHDYLGRLLARASGNVTRAAREAGLDRSHLGELLRKHKLK